ncbi:YcfL family protein [Vibrio sp.]|nr:YcfL family protein [Vibrio sp.]
MKISHNIKMALMSLMVAVFTVGCSSSDAVVSVDGEIQKVLFNGSDLQGKIDITEIATKDKNDRAQAIVRVINLTKDTLYIKHRFTWYDDDGLEINQKDSPWRLSVLRGLETLSVSEVSIHPEGREFRVQFRLSED